MNLDWIIIALPNADVHDCVHARLNGCAYVRVHDGNGHVHVSAHGRHVNPHGDDRAAPGKYLKSNFSHDYHCTFDRYLRQKIHSEQMP